MPRTPTTSEDLTRWYFDGASHDNVARMVTKFTDYETALDLVTDATKTSAGGLLTGKATLPTTPAAATGTVQGNVGMVFTLDLPDSAGTTNYDITTPDKIEIVDVVFIKNGAGAGNTTQVLNGASAISDASATVTDKAVTRAATIDRAQNTIAANAAFRVQTIRAAGSAAVKVFVYAVKRA